MFFILVVNSTLSHTETDESFTDKSTKGVFALSQIKSIKDLVHKSSALNLFSLLSFNITLK
jgi:hypothetical protein